MTMLRFAAIDVGSNAMRCHVVEVDGEGRPRVIESIREPVRLGNHVFHTGQIGAEATERTVEAFRLFRRLIDNHHAEHIRAVATSAVREAADSRTLLSRIREETGIEVRVIDGAEEAHLVRRAVGDRIDLSKGRSIAVDVGGGSVEVILIRDGDIARTESFTVGAVRLLQALKGTGEDSGEEFVQLLNDYVDAIHARVRTAVGQEPVDIYAATGGSIVSLADLVGRSATGAPVVAEGVRYIPIEDLRKCTLDLSRYSYNERVEKFGLREDRADVILPAATVYLKLGEIFGAAGVYVPDVGLKEGLILDMMDELERRGALEARRQEIRAAALGMGRRYALDEPHAVKVTELALSLFDQLRELHGLSEEYRTVLEAAGLLHDVGLYISAAKHHKHSYYLISESDIVGLSERQRELAANVARYHRKGHPTKRHLHFSALARDDREAVRRLAAILRVADVLDREHRQNVLTVFAVRERQRVVLEAVTTAKGDMLLERWAGGQKFKLFEEIFGLKVELGKGRK